MWIVERGRRYRFVDCAGTQYWGTVEETNQVGVRLSGVLFCLAEKDWMIVPGLDARTQEQEWRFLRGVFELYQ